MRGLAARRGLAALPLDLLRLVRSDCASEVRLAAAAIAPLLLPFRGVREGVVKRSPEVETARRITLLGLSFSASVPGVLMAVFCARGSRLRGRTGVFVTV
mmetsp:Transcript_17255/g.32728  ORF Transcript_17255/g.32728 Transcript_17255/m.32728 type:complete len:100 (-) Transcript_17255:396-695(-)